MPDVFWGQNPPWTIPRIREQVFWHSRPRPRPSGHFLHDWARTRWRLALVMLGAGFFSVFVTQMDIVYQIVVGAPVFEEALKFGLALLLVWWAPDPHGRAARWAWVPAVRILAALSVGAAFGVFEHYFSYPEEPVGFLVARTAFHAFSTTTSMVTFTLLEPLRDVRVRWLSTALATFLHYVNNAAALVGSVLVTATAGPEAALLVVPVLVTIGLLVLTVGLAWMGPWVRRVAAEQVQARLAAPGSPFGRRAAVPARGTPPTGR